MSKDRLLSNEELLTEVLSGSVYDYLSEEYQTQSAIPSELYDEAFGKLKKHRLDLINTQKRLYAESVIGEDELHKDWCAANREVICLCGEVVKRELRAEQRASL